MQTSRIIIAMGAAALALGGCGKKDEAPVVDTNVTNDANMVTGMPANDMAPAFSPGQTFANTAAASDAFEIESSKLALASSTSASVKKFAQQMIDAHTGSTAKLKTAAAAATPAITPDPTLSADQQAKLDGLKGKTGAEFDQAYIAAQQEGHQAALDAMRGYSVSGDVPALQDFAKATSATVAAHLNMAKALKP